MIRAFNEQLKYIGVIYEDDNLEALLPANKRYIHCVSSKSNIRLVVTMLPELVKHIHNVRYLAIDYTFKRIRGEFDEWEVASFLDRYGSRRLKIISATGEKLTNSL